MASRFRKIGVTSIGACAGVALATWTLNPFDRLYAVNRFNSLNHIYFALIQVERVMMNVDVVVFVRM